MDTVLLISWFYPDGSPIEGECVESVSKMTEAQALEVIEEFGLLFNEQLKVWWKMYELESHEFRVIEFTIPPEMAAKLYEEVG